MTQSRKWFCVAIVGFAIAGIVLTIGYLQDGQSSSKEIPDKFDDEAVTAISSTTNLVVADIDSTNESKDHDNSRIVFPDGTVVEVRLRQEAAAREPPDELASEYQDLQQAALAGDDSAAVVLHKGLSSCNSLRLFSQEDLDAALERLATERVMIVYDSNGEASSLYVGDDGGFSQLERNHEFCRGITVDQATESLEWLKLAADLGNPRSIQQYVLEAEGNTDLGRQYLESAVNSGWYNAAGLLASYYSNTSDELAGLSDPIVNEMYDPSKAYAYQYVFTRILEIDAQGHENIVKVYQQQLMDLEASISVRNVEDGLAEAKRMLINYDGCCVSIF